MNRKGIFVLGLILSTFLTVSLSSSVYAAEWLYYDDDGMEENWCTDDTGDMFAVRFSLPDGCHKAQLLQVQIYFESHDCDPPATIKIHVYDPLDNDLLLPFPTVTLTDCGGTYWEYWFTYDLSASNLVVSGDFYVAMEINSGECCIGVDKSAPISERSWSNEGTGWKQWGDREYMIRAQIDCLPPPQVGGDVFSVDKLAVITPYLLMAREA